MKKIDSVLKRHFQKLADPNKRADVLDSDEDDDASSRDEEGTSENSKTIADSESDADGSESEKSDEVCLFIVTIRRTSNDVMHFRVIYYSANHF
jgi:hypothetical protein